MSTSNCRNWGLAAKGFGRSLQQLLLGLGDCRFRRLFLAGRVLCRFQRGVGVDGVDQAGNEGLQRHPLGSGFDGLAVLGSQVMVQASEAAGEGGEHVRVAVAHPHQVQQLVERHGRLSVEGVGVGERRSP